MDERERLIEIMKSHGLNSKQFSLKLGVSAGSISNIIGGRNKPSLDFMQNVAKHFPNINHTWLFLDQGEMYTDGRTQITISPEEHDLFSQVDTPTSTTIPSVKHLKNNATNIPEVHSTPVHPVICSSKSVHKILIFYTDGTYEER